MKENKNPIHIKLKIGGTATLGPKGQVVIPKEIRENLGINPGDSVLFIYNTEKGQVGIIKNENLQNIMDYISSRGLTIEID